jgi:hypothetical protein
MAIYAFKNRKVHAALVMWLTQRSQAENQIIRPLCVSAAVQFCPAHAA